ncbi:MAG: Phosphoenolpyruvate-protein phosphotransferase, partial [Planctomycetota bacterium]
ILRDRTIEKDLFLKLKEGLSAENAVVATLDKYLEAFQKIKTPFFQERSFDLKDVFLRIMWNLKPVKNTGRHGDRVVLVCKEASVMELFAVSPEKLAGVIVEKGGPECHAAILARALSIPMVQIPTGFDALLTPGQTVLVAGPNSNVLINPTDETIAELTKIVAEDVVESAAPVSCDIPPRVLVNINLLWEVPSAINLGVAGVGLFRSEFMLLARRTVPTEEEQVEVYSKLLKSMNGKNTTIRTFDLRPDKVASFSDVGGVASRAYDWRRVLESAPLQKLFMEQLRAIMRAGVDGSPKILIPLVASTEVMDLVLKMYQEARESLVQEKIDFNQNIPLGLMIETAAAIPMIPFWSESVDFLALGTNDLFASVVGIDRNEENQNVLNDHLHPGFLRLVQSAIHYAHEAGKTMTVCGEFASEPLGALFLASMGIDTISVSVQKYRPICNILNKVNREELLKFSNSFIAMRKGDDVRGNLERILKSR